MIVTALASQFIKSGYREGWPRLVSQLEALYRVRELHGLDTAKAWLTEHGITWRELVQAPPHARAPPGAAGATSD